MKKRKIAIIGDLGFDQRLIAKFMEFNGAELIIVPNKITASKNATKEERELHKEKHLVQVRDKIRNVDGIILPGNKDDINPAHYGETFIHPETQKKLNTDSNNIRFYVEKTMLLSAIERQLPIVAICAGMQLVNVVMGGTLVQNIPDNSEHIDHKHDQDLDEQMIADWEQEFESHVFTGHPASIYNKHPHHVEVETDSALGKIYKKYIADVDLNNIHEVSIHHQGCSEENLADNLKVVATSSDGLVEAVELMDYPSLFIATQYHFEYNLGNIANGIFKELIEGTKDI